MGSIAHSPDREAHGRAALAFAGKHLQEWLSSAPAQRAPASGWNLDGAMASSPRHLLRWLLVTTVAALRTPSKPLTSNAAWPSSLTAHVARGVVATVAENTAQQGKWAGVKAAAELTRLIVDGLLIFPARSLPLGLRILRYRRSAVTEVPIEGGRGVEVYEGGGDGPLVVYVHGGSWGQGAAWQYALLARRLLEGGASRVAVVKYGLFPEADVDEMVDDVAAALEWARLQQAAAADDGRARLPIVLAAQSAGAHLCALHLARRCGAAATATASATAQPAGPWLPDRFVALSGVFDIAPHFAHESGRLVHWLSPMWQAMRGRDVVAPGGGSGSGGGSGGGDGDASRPCPARVATMAGERLALVPLPASCDAAAARAAGLCQLGAVEAVASGAPVAWDDAALSAWLAASPTLLLRRQRLAAGGGVDGGAGDGDGAEEGCGVDGGAAGEAGEAGEAACAACAAEWPPTLVLHAADDGTVPVTSAREFVAALRGVGGEVAYKEVAAAGHGEIMIALNQRTPLEQLPADLAEITTAFVREATAPAAAVAAQQEAAGA